MRREVGFRRLVEEGLALFAGSVVHLGQIRGHGNPEFLLRFADRQICVQIGGGEDPRDAPLEVRGGAVLVQGRGFDDEHKVASL